ncbi:MAG: formylmethanofuran dehydrogenase subunit C [Pirellulales bacterium]|nr:formylmethanofuran dehydrogenase subunit C [Pirellulales bacterium]
MKSQTNWNVPILVGPWLCKIGLVANLPAVPCEDRHLPHSLDDTYPVDIMPLTLTYTAETSIPVEIEGLTPTALRGKTLDEICQHTIFHGNEKLPLGEFFRVEGEPDDLVWNLYGNLAGVHWIGAHMEEGSIHIHGPVGRHLGSEMAGGQIVVDGDAGDWVGGEMHGGLIRVHGKSGHLVGAAYRGSRAGMTGGTILIDGDTGNELGHTMRRGWIGVGGNAGDMAGFGLLAGSLLIFGSCGIRPGAGMRRGTIGLFGAPTPELLPTFRHACRQRPLVLQMMLRRLVELEFPFDHELLQADFEQFHGDLLDGGRGEILVAANR